MTAGSVHDLTYQHRLHGVHWKIIMHVTGVTAAVTQASCVHAHECCSPAGPGIVEHQHSPPVTCDTSGMAMLKAVFLSTLKTRDDLSTTASPQLRPLTLSCSSCSRDTIRAAVSGDDVRRTPHCNLVLTESPAFMLIDIPHLDLLFKAAAGDAADFGQVL